MITSQFFPSHCHSENPLRWRGEHFQAHKHRATRYMHTFCEESREGSRSAGLGIDWRGEVAPLLDWSRRCQAAQGVERESTFSFKMWNGVSGVNSHMLLALPQTAERAPENLSRWINHRYWFVALNLCNDVFHGFVCLVTKIILIRFALQSLSFSC